MSNIYQKIDQFIFDQCEEIKNGPLYQKFTETIGQIQDQKKHLYATVAIFAFFVIPLTFLLILLFWNLNLSQGIDLKEQIQNNITQVNNIKMQHSSIANRIKTPLNLASINASKISEAFSGSNAGGGSGSSSGSSDLSPYLDRMTWSGMSSISQYTEMEESELELNFREMSTVEVMEMMEKIILQGKFFVEDINFTRNNETRLLNGKIKFLVFNNLAIDNIESENE
ncbi:MAG: hypothetical protein QE271_04225 [Bacteriovoracaceae bacterium]|nr:hypothetical protein [Bacteriovoracaceae bacterium]